MIEIELKFPETVLNDEDLQKYLWDRYHLDLDIDPESEQYGELFYNSDLRSFCGFTNDFETLIMWPEYYKLGWEETYYKNLIEDNIVVGGKQ